MTTARTHLAWRTSSRSQTSNCVEVAPLDEPATAVAIRDSKDAGGPVLVFARTPWESFLHAVRAGQFDV